MITSALIDSLPYVVENFYLLIFGFQNFVSEFYSIVLNVTVSRVIGDMRVLKEPGEAWGVSKAVS